MTAAERAPVLPGAAEWARRLGVPAHRIRLDPPPGTAGESDAIELDRRKEYGFELIDGVLVEKAMGLKESRLGSWIARLLGIFLESHELGDLSGEQGMMRVRPGQIRMPDVAFMSWERLNALSDPDAAAPPIAPELVIEVLSADNTEAEMLRKRREFFAAGTKLFWIVDPAERKVLVYAGPDSVTELRAGGVLTGGDVLPGFSLPVDDILARWDRISGGPDAAR